MGFTSAVKDLLVTVAQFTVNPPPPPPPVVEPPVVPLLLQDIATKTNKIIIEIPVKALLIIDRLMMEFFSDTNKRNRFNESCLHLINAL
jgi:hypothetical protein